MEQKGKDVTYKFPKNIIRDDENQEDCFNRLMTHHIPSFVEGHNVTYIAYGQTGAGKTFTMIAPVGSLNKKGGVDMSGSMLSHYGLFPRTTIAIFRELQNSGVTMTMSIVQCGGQAYVPTDLLNGSVIRIDNNHNYIGLTEVEINSEADLLDTFQKIEKLRYSDKTGMNATSSRTNAIMDFKCYKKYDDKVHINSFKFVDMAGAERIEKSGVSGATTKDGSLSLAGVVNNICLYHFQYCVYELSKLKKPVTGGDKVPKQVPWTGSEVTRVLYSAMNATSFTCFIFCIS